MPREVRTWDRPANPGHNASNVRHALPNRITDYFFDLFFPWHNVPIRQAFHDARPDYLRLSRLPFAESFPRRTRPNSINYVSGPKMGPYSFGKVTVDLSLFIWMTWKLSNDDYFPYAPISLLRETCRMAMPLSPG